MAGTEQDTRDRKLYFLEIFFFFLVMPPSARCSRYDINVDDKALQVLLQVVLFVKVESLFC